MNKKFKRSLIGYVPDAIEQKISSISADSLHQQEKLQEDLLDIQKENLELEVKIREVRSELDSIQAHRKNIEKNLYDAHIKATLILSEAVRNAEASRIKMQELYDGHKNEYIRIKNTFNSLMDDIHLNVKEFKSKLEDLPHVKNTGQNAG